MLELQKRISVSHGVACPIIFTLFYEVIGTGGVSKVMKNEHFLVLLVVWVFFPKFLGMLTSGLR